MTPCLPLSQWKLGIGKGSIISRPAYRLRKSLAAAETRLRLSALLAGASPDQDVTFQRVRVAPELAIAALSAEPVAEYGPILRSQGPGIVIPVGYTDTVFGYLPSARMLGQHGYEDEGFMKAFGIAGRFRPDIEEVVRWALQPHPPRTALPSP